MIAFCTSVEKKAEAAAVLLRLENGRMDRVRLLKLLYVADREALSQRAAPIVGGKVCAPVNGPVHREIYELIKGEHSSQPEWSAAIENEGHVVVLRKDPGRMQLSPYEIEKLTEVSERFRTLDSWALAEKTQEFPEWIEAYVEGACATIPTEKILACVGFTEQEIADVCDDTIAHARMSKLLNTTTEPAES